MAGYTTTYSGDLTTSLTSAIADQIFGIISEAKGQKEAAQKEAAKYGVDVEFDRGEFTARAARDRLIQNTLGSRFVPKTNYSDLLARGQSSNDPLMGVPAHLRKLPEYQQLANPKEKAFNQSSYLTGKNVPSNVQSTTAEKPVKVNDKKLGVFLAQVIKAINANIASLSERLDETQTDVIATREGLFGTIKQLEQNSDLLETKLDAIIDALRDQNTFAKQQQDREQVQRREGELEKEFDFSGTESLVKVGEDPTKREEINRKNDAEDFDPGETFTDITSYNDLGPGYERGGIASGPDSGYLAKLHGDELIIPLDNNYTQGEPSAIDGKIRQKPETPMMPQMAETGMMPTKAEPNFEKFGGNVFNKIAAVEPQAIPNLQEQTDNLTKAMELPIKASGVVTMSLMQKAVSGMGSIAGNVGEQLKSVSAPIASTFGVSNTITNNLIRQSENQAEEQDKRDEMKNSSATGGDRAWWDPLGVFTGRGGVGGYRRGTGGGGTKIQRFSNNYGTGGDQGLARGLKGVRAGFTGMGAQGFDAMMRGEGYIPSNKPQILGKGAYSAPTFRGANRYAGVVGSIPGQFQKPGGVVNSIVPGNAPKLNIFEPQSKVSAGMFNKGRDLATKLQGGAYPNSVRANMLRAQITSGGVRTPVRGGVTPTHPLIMLAQMLIEDLISPQPTAAYDQVTGPNAMYNNPKLSEEQRRVLFESVHGTQTQGAKTDFVNLRSQEQALNKLDKSVNQPDPIVINNQQTAATTSEDPFSRISNMGDPGFGALYPSPYN